MKRVLIPGFSGHPEIEPMFRQAGFAIDYALTEEERSLSRWDSSRAQIRQSMVDEALQELLPHASAISGSGPLGHLPITAEMIERARRLEVIYIGAAGFDRIDVEAATSRGIPVFNAPGGNAIGVAEHTLALMLTLARRIDTAANYARRNKRWTREPVMAARPPFGGLHGKTLGLVGFGYIGRHVAQKAIQGFGMNVIAYDPYFLPLEAERQGVRLIGSLDQLLQDADFVSMHIPLQEETRNLIGRREFGLMKKDAYFINTARGGTVDTDALVEALKLGEIGGAGIDCVEPEPLPDGHPLFDFENVLVTPHIGGAAMEDIERAALVAARLALNFLQTGDARHAVNPAALSRHAERARA